MSKSKFSPAEMSLLYLNSYFPVTNQIRNILSYNGEIHIYQKERWKKIGREDFENNVLRFLQRYSLGDQNYSSTSYLRDVVKNISSATAIPTTVTVPYDLAEMKSVPNLLFVTNGIIDLEETISSREVVFFKSEPRYFSQAYLATPYRPEAKMPTFEKICRESLGAEELIFLQQWWGYHFLKSTKYQKMLLMFGEGANGKSVLCLVLRELIGNENVSSVSLESFSGERTFPLSAIYGRLANIVEDLSEVSSVSEGILKKIVSGDTITFERKHRDPITAVFSAKLTFATNILPKFFDKSDGIWRRIILLHFQNQILDEKKQDKRFAQPEFWRKSGELSGVLNWALKGLIDLESGGGFKIPTSSRVNVSEYKSSSNPTDEFINDHLKCGIGKPLPSIDIYTEYSLWMRQRGCAPLSHNTFNAEVRRIFKDAYLSANARRIGGRRVRVWENLELIK